MRAGWRRGWSTSVVSPLLSLFSLIQLSLSRQVADFPSLSSIDQCMNAPKPLKVIFVVFFFRWWALWSLTPLHVALSCTTSSSRSLPLWRTTSTSAAVKPEPASVFTSLSPADSCLSSYLHSYLGMSATKELAFISVIIVPADYKRHEKWQSKKDLNLPLKRHTLSEIFLFWSGNGKQFSQIFPYDMDRITVWLSYALDGRRRSLEMRLFLDVSAVSPGGNLNALNPFLKGTSQWCTVLYYNVHSNIYRCVIMLSSGLVIRMSRKDHNKLLPSPKACNVLRCDWWRWVTDTHRCFEQYVPMCFAGWWWVEEE